MRTEGANEISGLTVVDQASDGDTPPQPLDNLRVIELQMKFMPEVCRVIEEGFREKRCCFVFSIPESEEEMRRRYAKYPASKLALGAVAIRDGSDAVLGCVQMAMKGHPVYPMNLHTCRPGEMYIEQIAVAEDARGMGIGTTLLRWCEAKARATEGITRLTLEVLRGNRCIGLYERFGFYQIPKHGACGGCCDAILVCCLMGRPYGYCNEGWGSIIMEKPLL